MDSVMRRTLVVLTAILLALGLFAPAGAIAGKKGGNADVHKPPYEKGYQGGDDWNHVEVDHKAGTVQVLRTFPGISPIVGCAPEPDAGWATLTLPHKVDKPVDEVVVSFDAMLDPYAWVYAVVWDHKDESLGLKKFQGPFAGSGKLTVKLFRRAPRGKTITVEFGAQVGDACPMVSGADVTFPKITIK